MTNVPVNCENKSVSDNYNCKSDAKNPSKEEYKPDDETSDNEYKNDAQTPDKYEHGKKRLMKACPETWNGKINYNKRRRGDEYLGFRNENGKIVNDIVFGKLGPECLSKNLARNLARKLGPQCLSKNCLKVKLLNYSKINDDE
ncbi:hypothetical protein CHUAL_001524 [Chamberlinius hualienensis]